MPIRCSRRPCSHAASRVADGHALAEPVAGSPYRYASPCILHVAVLAEMDQLVVPTQHRAEPDTGAGSRRTLPTRVAFGAIQLRGWASTRDCPRRYFILCSPQPDSAELDKVFRRLVERNAGIEQQVDQLNHHDRRQPHILKSHSDNLGTYSCARGSRYGASSRADHRERRPAAR